MSVDFKNDEAETEYKDICPALRIVCDYFISLSSGMGILSVITRVKEPVKGESGVHQVGRAVDFRDEMGVGGPRLYTDDQVEAIVKAMNLRFPRKDLKMTCIHHAFVNHAEPLSPRAPYHFHVQIPYDWSLDYQTMPKAA